MIPFLGRGAVRWNVTIKQVELYPELTAYKICQNKDLKKMFCYVYWGTPVDHYLSQQLFLVWDYRPAPAVFGDSPLSWSPWWWGSTVCEPPSRTRGRRRHRESRRNSPQSCPPLCAPYTWCPAESRWFVGPVMPAFQSCVFLAPRMEDCWEFPLSHHLQQSK